MALGGAPTVVIAGGGCSGTMLAAALSAASDDHPCHVVVIDPSETPGRGVAYGTHYPSHLLNVTAEQMSAHLDRPDDFANWANHHDAGLSGRSFAPRMVYGDYLESVWRKAQRGAAPRSSVLHIRGSVISVLDAAGGARVRVGIDNGTCIDADHLVLAMGNLTPSPATATRGIAASPRYIADPWRPGALDNIGGAVLLIGTGLTAVDVALMLADRYGVGTIRAVSRHGLLPREHRPGLVPTPALAEAPTGRTVRELVALLRRNADQQCDWRLAVDELRPHVAAVWRSLPDVERRRFMRHVSRFWEVHRHRMAPEIANRVAALMTAQRLRISRGSIESHRDLRDGVEVSVRRRGTSITDVFTAAHVINCTGPQLNVGAVGDPLIDGLLASGVVRPGPYGLGLDAESDGAIIDALGNPSRNLWVIGPLRRGVEWETTAAREIRAQAAALAQRLPMVTPEATQAPLPAAAHRAAPPMEKAAAIAAVAQAELLPSF
jgi:uncharacterized NAD(P)/FAD-binding protein YdhS